MRIEAVDDRPFYPGDESVPTSVLRGLALHFAPCASFVAALALVGDVVPVWLLWMTAPTPAVFLLAWVEQNDPYVEIPNKSFFEFVKGFGYMFFFAIVLTFPVVLGVWWLGAQVRSPNEALAGWWGIVAVLLLGDFFSYWLHRSLHTFRSDKKPLFPFGFRMHTLHHTTSYTHLIGNCTVPSETPTHPLEIPMLHGLMFGLAGATLGASFDATLAAMIMASMLTIPSHYNADLRIGSLRHVFCDCDHHRWHHGLDTIGNNLGLVFSFWDRLFGTHHQPHGFAGHMGVRGIDLPTSGWQRSLIVLPSHWKRMIKSW